VLVPVNYTSMEMSSLNINKSTKDDMDTRTASYDRSTGKGSVQNQIRDFTDTATGVHSHGCAPVLISQDSATVDCRRGKPPDYITRLHSLNQYVVVLTELAREKVLLLLCWKLSLWP
jgi:serine/threonine-protein kinase ULK/ATG1